MQDEMEFQYRRELDLFIKSLKDIAWGKKQNDFFIVMGDDGVGKTRLIKEFIEKIKSDPTIQHTPRIIEYKCSKESSISFLEPFIKIGEDIEKEGQLRLIFERVIYIIVTILQSFIPFLSLGVGTFNEIRKLSATLNKGEEISSTKEKEIYHKYIKQLSKGSKKIPWLLYFENFEWMDKHSILLLSELIERGEFYGIIILETRKTERKDTEGFYQFNHLVRLKNLNKIRLFPLKKGFEKKVLEHRYGKNIFKEDEYNKIYSIYKGVPGLLRKLITKWEEPNDFGQSFIRHEGGDTWVKEKDFEDTLIPPIEKLKKATKEILSDRIISDVEENMLMDFGKSLGLSKIEVRACISDAKLEIGLINGLERYQKIKDFIIRDGDRNIFYNTKKLIIARDDFAKISHILRDRFNLVHHSIRRINNVILIEDEYFIILEFIDTDVYKTVSNKIVHIKQSNAYLKQDDIVAIARQIAMGLNEAHRLNIVHGELIPSRIYISDSNDVKIDGFELSVINTVLPRKEKYEIEEVLYKPPERLTSKSQELNTKSDIYTFGVILYELISGENPFKDHDYDYERLCKLVKSGSKNILREKLDRKEIPVTRELVDIAYKCMDNESIRYGNFEDVLADLEKVPYYTRDQSKKGGEFEFRERGQSRKKIYTAASLAGIIVLTLLAYIFWPRHYRTIDMIVIDNFKTDESVPELSKMAETIQYLLMRACKQTTIPVCNIKTYEKISNANYSASIVIKGVLEKTVANYELTIQSEYKKENVDKNLRRKFPLNGESDILDTTIDKVFKYINDNAVSYLAYDTLTSYIPIKEQFTNNKDAYNYFYEGEKHWLKLNINEAQTQYTNAIQTDTTFNFAKVRLAQVLQFYGESGDAEQLINSVINSSRRTTTNDSLYIAGVNAMITSNYVDAQNYFNLLVNKDEFNSWYKYQLAEAYYNTAKVDEAIDHYLKVLEQDSTYSLAHNHLAYCYALKGEHENAEKHFAQYLKIDSTANAFDSFGDGYALRGDYTRAAEMKKNGIQKDPNLTYLYSSLSYIYTKSFQFDSARKYSDEYGRNAKSNRQKAEQYLLYAAANYFADNILSAFDNCSKGLGLYDGNKLNEMLPALNWLKALCALRLNKIRDAKQMYTKFETIVNDYSISPIKYDPFLKYYLHLKMMIALHDKKQADIEACLKTFDEIKERLSQGSIIFDRAFFMLECAKIKAKINNVQGAIETINGDVLSYNPNYTYAYYDLGKIMKSGIEKNILLKVYQDSVKIAYKNFIAECDSLKYRPKEYVEAMK